MLVIYHGGCFDGFCGAWLASKVWPDARFVPAKYGEPLPDLLDEDIRLIDFSYKRPEMLKLMSQARVTVYDHHKTAEAELKGLEGLDVYYDVGLSGARIFYNVEVAGRGIFEETPWLVSYTEDRDLWRWKLKDSREVNAYIRSFELDFDVWDKLHEEGWEKAAEHGAGIVRREDQIVRSAANNAGWWYIGDELALGVNHTTNLMSEVVGTLAETSGWAFGWFEKGKGSGYVYSLRSRGDVDVSEKAKGYGGGGHAVAAGFTVGEMVHVKPLVKLDMALDLLLEEGLVKYLKENNFKGTRSVAGCCPLSQYLQSKLGGQVRVAVCSDYIELILPNGEVLTKDIDGALSAFVVAFDAGLYPELIS